MEGSELFMGMSIKSLFKKTEKTENFVVIDPKMDGQNPSTPLNKLVIGKSCAGKGRKQYELRDSLQSK